MRNIKIVVISDLHCYYNSKENEFKAESYLLSNKLRKPTKNHPVQALIELIQKEALKVDYLFCPGDITNKADLQGFISGWEFVREIAEYLEIKKEHIFATMGNHDVDSKHAGSSNIFEVAKGIDRGFPVFNKSSREEFYSEGYTFIESSESRILIINSVFFHNTSEEIGRGKVDQTQIENIEKYLENNKDNKIQIALCHHHPVPHERLGLGLNDVIVNGNNLIEVLNKFNFDLFIHGHKHDAWLRYAPGSLNMLPVFASGSFSATTNQILTGKRNTFHIIELSKENSESSTGKIKTWEYLPTIGWKEADSGENSFPAHTGFGFKGKLDDLVTKASTIINKDFIDWSDFLEKLPEVQFLTPDECLSFRSSLKNDHNIITHPELPKMPEIIGKPFKP